jgi:hypothetical protein
MVDIKRTEQNTDRNLISNLVSILTISSLGLT